MNEKERLQNEIIVEKQKTNIDAKNGQVCALS